MASKEQITAQTLYEKLFTHEDIMNIHKTLGVLSMISVLMRMRYIGVEHDMGFQTWPEYTIPTILLHWTAVISSLIFKIPAKRIKQGNRLWPQARLHNICFVSRHLVVILLYWMEQVYGWEPNYWRNYAILIGNMMLADYVTNSVKHPSNTIRDLEAHPGAKYFFSMVQFSASGFFLLGIRRSSAHFYVVFVIQLTAFMTTLQRKNVGNHKIGVFIYGSVLAGGILVRAIDMVPEGGPYILALMEVVARSVALIRIAGPSWLGPLKNKYVLWTTAAIFFQYARPMGPNPHSFAIWLQEEMSMYVKALALTLVGATFLHGYWTAKRQLPAFKAVAKSQ